MRSPRISLLARRLRLPLSDLITIETIHAAFKVSRDRDAQYDPPGRLRHYDLIILDEVSQIDGQVWRCLQIALNELRPSPYVVFVGDFQQLQPVHGEHILHQDLQREEAAGQLRRIELQQHAAARSNDPEMLAFLAWARVHQPSRNCLENFFHGRRLSRDKDEAVQQAMRIERSSGKQFTFLTVTNRGAQSLNLAHLRAEFAAAADRIENMHQCVVGDPTAEAGLLVLQEGMRVRLTRNLDKDRGFVNGNVGVIEKMLTQDVFVLRTIQGTRILVHPVTDKGETFAPCPAYARRLALFLYLVLCVYLVLKGNPVESKNGPLPLWGTCGLCLCHHNATRARLHAGLGRSILWQNVRRPGLCLRRCLQGKAQGRRLLAGPRPQDKLAAGRRGPTRKWAGIPGAFQLVRFRRQFGQLVP